MLNGSMFEVSMKEHFREMEYIRQRLREAEAVIEQLHRGYPLPGKPVYIHPADFSEILNELTAKNNTIDVYRTNIKGEYTNSNVVSGIQYVQTTAMPKITKKFD